MSTASHPVVDPGSFRDRKGRVFYRNGGVYRGLSPSALQQWEALSRTSFFRRGVAEGRIVGTERVEPDGVTGWAGVLRHEVVPYVSYPYEWTFGMLRAAALLELDLLLEALDEGMILKDSSSFNVQWRGSRPVFIDVPSFETLVPGEPWAGYRQFCQMYLHPLLLQSFRDVPFQPWLRGHIDGIESAHLVRLLSLRDLLRRGVFTHVYLQSKLESRYAGTNEDLKKALRSAGFHAGLIRNNARRLRRIVERLAWRRSRSTWSDYAPAASYEAGSLEKKEAFVREVVSSRRWKLVWDLGCNTGTFSRIAARNAEYVVAMDGDDLAVERLYRDLEAEGNTSILPLVIPLADPSPNLGWRGLERKGLPERGRPELTLCLALVHHLVIGANIPLPDLFDWLATLGGSLVIEFVGREDEMVKTLLRNKEDIYVDYDEAPFERSLEERFEVVGRERLKGGKRILYHARARR